MKTEYSIWICDVEKDSKELRNDLNQNSATGHELVTSYLKDKGKTIVFIFKKTSE